MTDIAPLIASFLGGSNLPQVSKDWHQAITRSDKSILADLERRYPASNVQSAIIQAMKANDIPMLRNISGMYQGFLPVRWDIIAMNAPDLGTLKIIRNRIDTDLYNDIVRYKFASTDEVVNEIRNLLNNGEYDMLDHITMLLFNMGRIDVLRELTYIFGNILDPYLEQRVTGQTNDVQPLSFFNDADRLRYYNDIVRNDAVYLYERDGYGITENLRLYLDEAYGDVLRTMLRNSLDRVMDYVSTASYEPRRDVSKELEDMYRRNPMDRTKIAALMLHAGYVELLDKYGDDVDWPNVMQYISDRDSLPVQSRRFLATLNY